MANWSADRYFLGRVVQADPHLNLRQYTPVQQELVRLLRFDGHDLPYVITDIKCFGPALQVRGCGKWCCGIPIPDAIWNTLKSGIVVSRCFAGDGDETIQEILVGGEIVLRESRFLWDVDGWTEYEGRTSDENHFFEELWRPLRVEQARFDADNPNWRERVQREKMENDSYVHKQGIRSAIIHNVVDAVDVNDENG